MHSAASLPGIMSQRRGFAERKRELITEPISDAGLLDALRASGTRPHSRNS